MDVPFANVTPPPPPPPRTSHCEKFFSAENRLQVTPFVNFETVFKKSYMPWRKYALSKCFCFILCPLHSRSTPFYCCCSYLPVITCFFQQLRLDINQKFRSGKFSWDDMSVHEATGLLKQLLRDLPVPLMTQEYFNAFTLIESRYKLVVLC